MEEIKRNVMNKISIPIHFTRCVKSINSLCEHPVMDDELHLAYDELQI